MVEHNRVEIHSLKTQDDFEYVDGMNCRHIIHIRPDIYDVFGAEVDDDVCIRIREPKEVRYSVRKQ
jgi:hypothetical protein